LSGNVTVKIYKTVIVPVVLYGCEICSLTLKEQYGLRVFENSVLRTVFGPKEMKEWKNEQSYTTGSFIIYTHPQIYLGKSNQWK
jgi:hypothetical protein